MLLQEPGQTTGQHAQHLLGRSLNTEELKILLGFVRYLGMSADVISVLICYCKNRARQRGSMRNPSLRTIEKEAYAWAEQGIETVEDASAFIQAQNVRSSRLYRLMNILQIRGRSLTTAEERYAQNWLDMGMEEEVLSMAYERTCLNTGGLNWAYMNKILQRLTTAEERYAQNWLDMGMEEEVLSMAYERTCLNTGGLNWAYMNKILQRWNEQGLRTAEDVRSGDHKTNVPKGASGQLGTAELEAIQRLLREE